MKKLLFALCSFSFLLAGAQSKKEVVLKPYYKPGMDYTSTMDISMDMLIGYDASPEVLAELEEEGIENPTKQSMSSQIVSQVSTGKMTSQNKFPVEMRILSSSSDLEKTMGKNVIIHGTATTDAFPVFDSISGDYKKEYKDMIIPMMKNLLSKIQFPEKTLKIGESTAISTPMTVPVGGTNMEMKITTTYTLVGIEGSNANFDVDMQLELAAELEGYKAAATGTGKGKMVYDTAVTFVKSFITKMDMNMDVDMDNDVTMNMKSSVSTDVNVEVTKR